MTATVGGLLDRAVEKYAGRPAFLWGSGELSYGEIDVLVARLAKRLERLAGPTGLVGERIAIIAPNVPALAIATFAAWRVGGVAVPLTSRLRDRELEQTLAHAEPLAVVCVAAHGGYSFAELLRRLVPDLPSIRSCLVVDPTGEVEQEIRGTGRQAAEPLAAEFAALLYTSGTTGAPKGALVRHAREAKGGPKLAELLDLRPEDRAVLVVPISHAYGLTCFLGTIAAGAAAILVESTFSPRPLLAGIDNGRATILHGSPTLFTSLLKTRPAGNLGIRGGFVAGAPSPPRLLEELEARGMLVLNLYGLTETGAVSACRPDDSAEHRRTTVGRPLPEFAVRLADDGVLELRGPYVTPGYFRQRDEDSDAFADGWFRTGDLATIESGYVRIVGRAKDIVHVGGFNVVPAEVEAVLLEHPDVAQAVVVGRPDDRMGEALEAYVVVRPGSSVAPADLVRFARARVAGYKVPYALRILPTLPVLGSGKPDRMALSAAASSAGDR